MATRKRTPWQSAEYLLPITEGSVACLLANQVKMQWQLKEKIFLSDHMLIFQKPRLWLESSLSVPTSENVSASFTSHSGKCHLKDSLFQTFNSFKFLQRLQHTAQALFAIKKSWLFLNQVLLSMTVFSFRSQQFADSSYTLEGNHF